MGQNIYLGMASPTLHPFIYHILFFFFAFILFLTQNGTYVNIKKWKEMLKKNGTNLSLFKFKYAKKGKIQNRCGIGDGSLGILLKFWILGKKKDKDWRSSYVIYIIIEPRSFIILVQPKTWVELFWTTRALKYWVWLNYFTCLELELDLTSWALKEPSAVHLLFVIVTLLEVWVFTKTVLTAKSS